MCPGYHAYELVGIISVILKLVSVILKLVKLLALRGRLISCYLCMEILSYPKIQESLACCLLETQRVIMAFCVFRKIQRSFKLVRRDGLRLHVVEGINTHVLLIT